MLTSGVISAQLMVLASLGNYLIFFGGDLVRSVTRLKSRAKWTANQMSEVKRTSVARHKCTICNIDSNSNPFEDFRYCSKCDGQHAYCEKHLRDHEHVK